MSAEFTDKQCYTIWEPIFKGNMRAGGKVVWLTDVQLTYYQLKYPEKIFYPIDEDNLMEKYGKYREQTVD